MTDCFFFVGMVSNILKLIRLTTIAVLGLGVWVISEHVAIVAINFLICLLYNKPVGNLSLNIYLCHSI
jgi:hypothetical protein